MTNSNSNRICDVIEAHHQDIFEGWMLELKRRVIQLTGPEEAQIRQHSEQFLVALVKAIRAGQEEDIEAAEWDDARYLLTEISEFRARKGFKPSETALFILSLKKSLFAQLHNTLADQPGELADDTWLIGSLLDKLGVFVMEVYQKSREQIIARQQQELLELSTPVVSLWDGVLALPLIGTLDSVRAQTVMESLLQEIVDSGSAIAIIDISGVPTVDTLVAQHLLKTVAATRLMGADCIISGIRPQIAQTIVQMGIDLEGVTTKSSLADAFVAALERSGTNISRQPAR